MGIAFPPFHAKVQDELGWNYPDAFVAIRHAHESSEKTMITSDFNNFNVENDIKILAYRANFWGDEETFRRLEAKNSRPLVNTSGDDPDLFTVDLNTSESINVMNGPMSSDDKTLELIRLDIIRRFK